MGKRETTFSGLRDGFGSFHQTLVELKPREQISLWNAAGGGYTNTYYADVTQRTKQHNHRTVAAVQADNTELTSRASLALVDANPGSYYFDTSIDRLYVSLGTPADPTIGHLVTFDFWLYFSLGGEFQGVPADYNGQDYRALLMAVPTVVREAQEQLWGTPVTGSGTIVLANPQVNASSGEFGAGIWDDLFETYIWIGALAIVYFGGDDLAYGTFRRVWSGRVQDATWTDSEFSLQVYDAGEELNRPPVASVIDTTTYPNAAADAVNHDMPILYGSCRGIRAWCTDTTTLQFSICRHAVVAVERVTVGGVEAIPYSVTLASGRFTLDETWRTAIITDRTEVLVDVCGKPDGLSDLMTNPADITADIIDNYTTGMAGYRETASFAAARLASAAFHLSLAPSPTESLRDIFDRICRSCMAYLYVDENNQYVMNVWGPVRADVVADRAVLEAAGSIGSVTATLEASRCIGGSLIESAGEAVVSQSTDAVGRVYDYTDVTAVQLTRRYDKLQIGNTALEDIECAGLLAQKLGIIYGSPVMRFEFDTNKRLFDLTVNSVVTLTRRRAPDSSGTGWGSRLARVLRIEMSPTEVSGKVLLEDLTGRMVANYGTWKAAGSNNWDASSTIEKAAGGFWTDANGRAKTAEANSYGWSLWG